MNGFTGIGLVVLEISYRETGKYKWQREIDTIVYLKVSR